MILEVMAEMEFSSGKNIRLLVVESDETLVEQIYAYLEPLGYDLDRAANGLLGWQRAASGAYDLLLIDVMLPGMDGLTLCRRLRSESGSEVPVIMITSSESVESRVLCLNWGADDFLVKPFDMLELEARVLAAIRLSKAHLAIPRLSWAGIELDLRAHTVAAEGQPLHLPPMAFLLLARLMKEAPNIVSRAELQKELYGDSPPNSDALRTYIHILRSKLTEAGKPLLQTVPRVGFRLGAD